jgi:hypothetical protein
MSRHSPDEQPTTVLQQPTAEQPGVTAVPATRRTRIWQRKVPSRIGRARTSTVTIGCLFVLLSALNSALPQPDNRTVPVTYNGRTIDVPVSALPSDARPTTTAPTTAPTAPAPTTAVPTPAAPPSTSTSAPTGTTSAPRTTTRAPQTTADEEPATTAPRTTSTPRNEDQPTLAPGTSRAPATTSRAPATTAEESSVAPTS